MLAVARLSAAVSVLLLLASGCGASDDKATEGPTEGASGTEVTSAGVPKGHPIVGEWKRVTKCSELVRVLREAGLGELAASVAADNGLVPYANAERPCKGAVPREHSHFFTEDGLFGSRDWRGEQVDDGRYEVDGNTLVISKEFGEVRFRYSIEGGGLRLTPDDREECEFFACEWRVVMAYPGYEWHRVQP
ncbi:MAG: hypothetical protein M3327_01100 [Actinomycetota bacterium]|nr:hypothetical protein [Actinomycetota bacterium]